LTLADYKDSIVDLEPTHQQQQQEGL